MKTTHTDTGSLGAKGLLAGLLVLAVVMAVSPVYVMPGCTMERGGLFDFSCEHGVITQHITEMPTAASGPALAALVAVALVLLLGVRLAHASTIGPVDHPVVGDPLGERLRT